MKALITFIILSLSALATYAQSAQTYFNNSASYYVKDKKVEAMQTIRDGLAKYPNDEKLTALAEKMKQEKKEQDKKDQEKKEQEKKDQQQKKDGDNKEQQKKEQEKKEEQQKNEEKKKEEQEKNQNKDQQKKDDQKDPEKDKEQKEQEKKDQQKQAQPNPFEGMKISPEKAAMILEAMKNQEVQYIQQNKRKATKSKDKSKPDW